MTKPKRPRLPSPKSKAKTTKTEESLVSESEVFDEDAVLKDFVTHNVEDVIQLIKPDLHAVVNWAIAPEFWEQELINSLRGRLRVKGKRKVADKLIKLRLLNGKDHFVFIHNEIQHELEDDLALRWYKSRSFISLRYNMEDITTIIIFTGKAPLGKHFIYRHECFGTISYFKVNAYTVIKQNVKQLIASTNPAAIAVLAAKYTLMSEGNDKKRLRLKKKVIDLVQQKGFPLEKLMNVVNFVFDYMLLPPKMEEALKAETPFFEPIKEKEMEMTKERWDYIEAAFIHKTGKTYFGNILERDAKITALEAEAAAAKEAAKEEHRKTVHSMLKKGYSLEEIADILDKDLSYITELATAKQG